MVLPAEIPSIAYLPKSIPINVLLRPSAKAAAHRDESMLYHHTANAAPVQHYLSSEEDYMLDLIVVVAIIGAFTAFICYARGIDHLQKKP